MPAPLLVPLILLGGATVALAAASAKKKKEQYEPDAPPGTTPRTYTLDVGMPPRLRDQVLAALATEKDPTKLEAFAAGIASSFPLSAAALRTKEAMILSLQAPVPLPQPAPWQPPTPDPLPPILVQPAPAPAIPVPIAPTPVQPTPATPSIPAPTPVAPTPPLSGLDPGMPIEVQKAVLGALTTESDPAKLQGFASAIQAQYPIAAGLLMAKAQALLLMHPPAPGPISPTPMPAMPFPVPSMPPVPPSPGPSLPGSYPIGDASTRSGRNAGRPTGYPFILLHGESTYPAKISQQATGTEANYPQMTKLNPQFAKDGVHWMTIQKGDALNVPWSWAPKLVSLYRIQVDPGVGVPSVAAPSLAVSGEPTTEVGASPRRITHQRPARLPAVTHARSHALAASNSESNSFPDETTDDGGFNGVSPGA
jgi:hypothetical protein